MRLRQAKKVFQRVAVMTQARVICGLPIVPSRDWIRELYRSETVERAYWRRAKAERRNGPIRIPLEDIELPADIKIDGPIPPEFFDGLLRSGMLKTKCEGCGQHWFTRTEPTPVKCPSCDPESFGLPLVN